MKVQTPTDMGDPRLRRFSTALLLLVLAPAVLAVQAGAQSFVEELTAVSANVSEPGQPVRINILAWSSAEDRERLITALDPPPRPPEPAAELAEGRGGRGRGGRGAGGRGRGGFGGRGGRGAVPVDPVLAALDEASTVGYLWTDQVSGYSIRYADREPLPNGGERIVLVTNRRLGAYTPAWDPVGTDYEYTLIEIRLDPNGVGEGKTSLTTDVVVDAGNPALADYGDTNAVLENVRR